MNERNGNRKTRNKSLNQRVPNLGYYIIVTDTKETEKNYMNGLRKSIPKELQEKLVIKVIKTDTKDLVEKAKNEASLNPQYGEIWIIFDRDQVPGFDIIIQHAENSGIHVGWTNPCIETWLSAYFGKIITNPDSVSCCKEFGRIYKNKTGQDYKKSSSDIYDKLTQFGDENNAIKLAENKFKEHQLNGKKKPSEMCPCTTVHLLVKEIKSKIK